jgi:hypothetical protein
MKHFELFYHVEDQVQVVSTEEAPSQRQPCGLSLISFVKNYPTFVENAKTQHRGLTIFGHKGYSRIYSFLALEPNLHRTTSREENVKQGVGENCSYEDFCFEYSL